MDQPEFELQLKVWKELAVSKQILMRTATDALGLDPECSSDERREALAKAVERTRAAEVDAKRARDETKAAKIALDKATSQYTETKTALDEAENRVIAGREANNATVKKVNAQLTEQRKALKAINTALADTPENVVKKLKALKKEKFDESTARKRAEAEALSLRKEKQNLQKRLTEAESTLEGGADVASKCRELHKLCMDLHARVDAHSEDDSELAKVPDLDEELLERLEKKANDED